MSRSFARRSKLLASSPPASGESTSRSWRSRARWSGAQRLLLAVSIGIFGFALVNATPGAAQRATTSNEKNAPGTDFVVATGLANSTVVVQITTDNYDTGDGWTAAYSCDTGFLGTSSLNNTASPVASNLVIVHTNAAGEFCVKAYKSTDLVVDLLGTIGGASIGTPSRVFDSRSAGGPATDRRVGVGVAGSSVVLQVTTDNYGNAGTGWTAVYNCDEGFKGTSSLNNRANPVASNTVIAKADRNGEVCIKSQYPSDHIVDVIGTITDASVHTPARVFDSRTTGTPTATPSRFVVGVPNAVVVLQVTTDNYTGGTGWTAVFGCRGGFHGTSSLNNTGNPVASNLVIVPTDDSGSVCFQSYRPTDIIVDVIGTLTNSSIHTPIRILDTRTSAATIPPILPTTRPPTTRPPTTPTQPPATQSPDTLPPATVSSNPGDTTNC